MNWIVETNHRIRWEFEAFIRNACASQVPLAFSLQQFDTPNEGVIQLRPGILAVGVVNRRLDPLLDDESANDVHVFEDGGELVASQSFLGHVHFIAHPRHSDRSKPKKSEIILYGPLDPVDVTPALIRKAIDRYLLVLRSTSVLGMGDTFTVRERLAVLWIYFWDIRKRNQLIRSVLAMTNEWSKVIAAGLVGLIVVYLSASNAR